MVILTLNCGSSSVKFQVYGWDRNTVLGVGMVERIGERGAGIEHRRHQGPPCTALAECPDHKTAVQWITRILVHPDHGCLEDMNSIRAVGHRVVHGGETFTRSVIVSKEVLRKIEACSPLAPLHNPANITGIRAAMEVLPDALHCAVMDTAWHQTMPAAGFMYALPYPWYREHKVRRYGFHGTSYIYTAKRAAVLLGKAPGETNLIIAHVGNGSSICAVKNGRSIDTSLGMTPLEGLMMGTRCGDIDPAIVPYMMRRENLDPAGMEVILNQKSGVLGVTETHIDRRDVHSGAQEGDERCILAMEMECRRIKKYIGAYFTLLGQTDAVVFTAGVGEMNPTYRLGALENLEALGIIIDKSRNQASRTRNAETRISADDSPVKVFVIPTDEELVITEDAHALMRGGYDVHTRFTYSFESPNYRNHPRDAALESDMKNNPALGQALIAPPPGPELQESPLGG